MTAFSDVTIGPAPVTVTGGRMLGDKCLCGASLMRILEFSEGTYGRWESTRWVCTRRSGCP